MTFESSSRGVLCLMVALVWLGSGAAGELVHPASSTNSREAVWVIQVGAYRVAANAEATSGELQERRYRSRVVESTVEGQRYYQVRVGQFSTRSEAREQARRMVEEGAIGDYLLLRVSDPSPDDPGDSPRLRSLEIEGASSGTPPQTPAIRRDTGGADTRSVQGSPGDGQSLDFEVTRRRNGSDSPGALGLEKAYRIALRRNERVRISREDLRQTRQARRITTAGLLPQLDLVSEANRQKVNPTAGSLSTNEENLTGTLSLTQPLYYGGRLWSSRAAARYRVQGQEKDYFRTRQEILLTVANRFYGVLLAQYQINIAQNTLRRAQRQLDQAQARFEVKAISRTPVLRAKVQVSEAREQLERARNQYDVAREDLALELGLEQPPPDLEVPSPHSFEGEEMQTYFQRALSHRRDYQEARFSVRENRERLDVEQAEWLPRFDLEAEGSRFENEVLGQDEDWTVSAVMTYPLYSGGQATAEIDQQESRLRQSKQQRDRLKRQIRLEVRRTYLNIQTQREVIQSLEDQVQSARENYRQVSARFREGLANSVDVSDAITVLNEAESRLATARIQYQLGVLGLRLATGTYQQKLLEKGSLTDEDP